MASSVRSWLLFIAASAANFAVMYNFNSIAMALLIMSESECTLDNGCKDGSQEKWVNSASNGVIFIGAVLGQLIFGYLGDKLGRGGGMAIVLIITTIAAVLSGLIPTGDPSDVYASVIAARLVLGLGVGGIYPLAATMATEINQAQREPSRSQSLINAGTYNAVSSSDKYANMGKNGKKEDLDVMACSWASFWQQPGIMGPWLVGYILTYTRVSTNWRWRLVLMIGGVPSFLALIALAIEYVSFPRRGPSLSEQLNDDQDEELKPKKATIGELFMSKETLWKLIGCGGSWFLFDTICFSVALLGGHLIYDIYNNKDESTGEADISGDHSIRSVCVKYFITVFVSIVATFISVFLIPLLGLKRLQMISFVVIAGGFLVLAATFEPLKAYPNVVFVLLCVLTALISMGANLTTYTVPGIIVEKRIRSTFSGTCAAVGKFGAATGSLALTPITEMGAHGFTAALATCCVVSLCGAWVTQRLVHIDDDERLCRRSTVGNANDSVYTLYDGGEHTGDRDLLVSIGVRA